MPHRLRCGFFTPAAGAKTVAFWVSSPVLHGETVLLLGHDLGASSRVGVQASGAGAKAQTAVILQKRPRSLKFVLPTNGPEGMYRARISTPSGTLQVLVNAPRVT